MSSMKMKNFQGSLKKSKTDCPRRHRCTDWHHLKRTTSEQGSWTGTCRRM